MVKRLWLGIGVAIGLAIWPLLLPVVWLIALVAVLRHGARSGQRPTRRQHQANSSPQPQPSSPSTVLDPLVRAKVLAQVERINTEVQRDRLERSFSERL